MDKTLKGSDQNNLGKPALVGEIIDFLETLASPSPLTSKTPHGLQVGGESSPIRSIVLAPYASHSALSIAASQMHSLLITATPLITTPIQNILHEDPIGSKIKYLIENRINLYCLSDSLLSIYGGFDDCLAEAVGLPTCKLVKTAAYEKMSKIVVFTPLSALDQVMHAAADAGAGRVGNYTHCSFQTMGVGTFLPEEGANPVIGSVGYLERVEEIKLEMVAPQWRMRKVIDAILAAHPYEEVAYDLMSVSSPGEPYGRGRIGALPLKVTLKAFAERVRETLSAKSIRLSHHTDKLISTVSVATGMEEGLFFDAQRMGADIHITGGATVRDWMLADGGPTIILDIGYSESLEPGLKKLGDQISRAFQPRGVKLIQSI